MITYSAFVAVLEFNCGARAFAVLLGNSEAIIFMLTASVWI